MTVTAPSAPQPLSGERVLITGTLPSLSREQAKDAVRALGGESLSSTSPTLTLVIAGEGAGHAKMQRLAAIPNLRVLQGAAFEALVHDPSVDVPVGEPLTVAQPAEERQVRLPLHLVSAVTTYPPGQIRLTRLRCRCGNRWETSELHGGLQVCPDSTPETRLVRQYEPTKD